MAGTQDNGTLATFTRQDEQQPLKRIAINGENNN